MSESEGKPVKITIGAKVDSTIQLYSGHGENFNFIKPGAWVEMEFSELPSQKQLEEAWSKIWEDHLGPQHEQMIDLMSKEIDKKFSPWRNGTKVTPDEVEVPDVKAVYE